MTNAIDSPLQGMQTQRGKDSNHESNDHQLARAAQIWRDVLERGAAPIAAPLPPPVWRRLYNALDEFGEYIDGHDEYADIFDKTAKSWQAHSGLGLHFSGYFSPYFRNRVGELGKDQKKIFQFCEPYFRY